LRVSWIGRLSSVCRIDARFVGAAAGPRRAAEHGRL